MLHFIMDKTFAATVPHNQQGKCKYMKKYLHIFFSHPVLSFSFLVGPDPASDTFLLCFHPSQQSSPTQPLGHSPTSGIVERTGKAEAGKLLV